MRDQSSPCQVRRSEKRTHPCKVLTILLSLSLSSTLVTPLGGGGMNGLVSFSVFSALCKLPIFLLPGFCPPLMPAAPPEAALLREEEEPSLSRGVCSFGRSLLLFPAEREELLGLRGKQHGKRQAAREATCDDAGILCLTLCLSPARSRRGGRLLLAP